MATQIQPSPATGENSFKGDRGGRPEVLLPIEAALLGRDSATQERLFRGLLLLTPSERLSVIYRFCVTCGKTYDKCRC